MRLIDANALLIELEFADYSAIDIKNLITNAPTIQREGWVSDDTKRLSDEDISLMAFNDDQNDWDSLQFKECWHEGYIKGAKAIMAAMQELNK